MHRYCVSWRVSSVSAVCWSMPQPMCWPMFRQDQILYLYLDLTVLPFFVRQHDEVLICVFLSVKSLFNLVKPKTHLSTWLIRMMDESITKVYESCASSSSLIMFLFQNADIQLEPLGSKTEQWGDQETLKCPSKV